MVSPLVSSRHLQHFLLVLLLVVPSSLVHGYSFYLDYLPNGRSVRSSSGSYCNAFGHSSCGHGSGSNVNTFGNDFGNEGGWTSNLCKSDSDGDGKSNGDELGDPCCIWSQGSNPTLSTAYHPSDSGVKPTFPSCSLAGVPSTPTITGFANSGSCVRFDLSVSASSCACFVRFSITSGLTGSVASQGPFFIYGSSTPQVTICSLPANFTATATYANVAGSSVVSSLVSVNASSINPSLTLTATPVTSTTMKTSSFNTSKNILNLGPYGAAVLAGILLSCAPILIISFLRCCTSSSPSSSSWQNKKPLLLDFFTEGSLWSYIGSFSIVGFSASELIALVFYLLGLFVSWLVARSSFETQGDKLYRSFGIVAIVNLFLAVLLPLRHSILQGLAGPSAHRFMPVHRLVGTLAVASVVIHGGGEIVDHGLSSVVSAQSNNLATFAGFLTLPFSLFLFATSIYYVRRNHWEIFRYSHFIFIAIYVASMFHLPQGFAIFLVPLIFWVIDSLLSFYNVLTSPWRLQKWESFSSEVVRITLQPKASSSSSTLSRPLPFQFYLLHVPALSSLQWHPFSISASGITGIPAPPQSSNFPGSPGYSRGTELAGLTITSSTSSPTASPSTSASPSPLQSPASVSSLTGLSVGAGGSGLSVHIAAGAPGSFTHRLYELVQKRHGFAGDVQLLGPFGGSSIDLHRDQLLMVAGGIGITPFSALLCELALSKKENRAPSFSSYSSSSSSPTIKAVKLLWAVKSLDYLAPFDEIFSFISSTLGNSLSVNVYVTRGAVASRFSWAKVTQGRPDVRAALDAAFEVQLNGKSVGVLGCGPQKMVKEVEMGCSELSLPFHKDEFLL
eukprot:GILI01002093.1.p1 GENE.GILI01002093.1~~GILI01002093.1.p1  ORF type:complete len:844 (+),score=175.95 GILI01002093.1:136-2667(+)